MTHAESAALNLALNKPALQSSTSVWSGTRTAAEDARGANNGDASGEMGFHTSRESNPWWQVDLGDPARVTRVVIWNRRHMAERLRFFSVLTSLEGRHWQLAFKKRDDSVFGAAADDPYVVDIAEGAPARFVRLRLDGHEPLHFSELEVYGAPLDVDAHGRLLDAERAAAAARVALPVGRSGRIVDVGGFAIFADAAYDPEIVAALESGGYEGPERALVPRLLAPTDRVLEVGTAAGLVTLAVAAVVGAERIVTFEANAAILEDARDNFHRNGFGAIAARHGLLRNIRAFAAGESAPFGVSVRFWSSRQPGYGGETDIARVVDVPTFCLEREILAHDANVLICDIEGAETELLTDADLPGITLILMETHYRYAGRPRTDAMVRSLIMKGFSLDLSVCVGEMLVLRR